MAKVTNRPHVEHMHGKVKKHSDEYYYVVHGQQYARARQETYQRNQSPMQKWNSASFAYAHQEIQKLTTPEAIDAYTQEWHAALKIGPNGRPYANAKSWKFASLKQDWRNAHPYEQWYTDYLQTLTQTAQAKTNSEKPSVFIIRQQLTALHAEIDRLQSLLPKEE